MITPEQLAQWRALADAATPGPWEATSTWSDDGDSYYVAVVDGRALLDTYVSMTDANAAFIAAAREAVPALLALVENLENLIDKQDRDTATLQTALRSQAATVDELQAEVERLRAAPASHYAALISGKPEPTDAENEAAADRITRMNALYGQFGNDVTTWPDWALVKLDRLQSEQGRYEAQYC